MSPKKEKKLYDESGHWVEEKGRIKGAIRRVFRLSPQMKEALKAARVELPQYNQDGSLSKRPAVRFKCACCGELFSQKNVQVDHIDPVIPLWQSQGDLSYDEMIKRIFCNKGNLQILCSTPLKKNNGKPSCHKKKTDKENFLRDRFKETDLHYAIEGGKHNLIEMIAGFEKEYNLFLLEKEKLKQQKEERKQRKNKSLENKV